MRYVILSNVIDQLKSFYDNDKNGLPLYYISYQNIPNLKMNKPSYDNSPLGIYAYPLRQIYKDIKTGVPYGKKRSYIFVLKLVSKQVLNLNNYTNFDKDWETLEKYCYVKNNITDEKVNLYLPNKYNPDNDWITDEYIKDFKKHDTPYEICYHIAKALNKNKSIVLWNKLLQKVLKYDAVLDNGKGIINYNEPYQICFLNTKAYKIETVLNNDIKYKHSIITDDPYERQDFETSFKSMDY